MKITVGISCYNHAQYLPEAIESVLNQTYKDIELIVVNDGSPDNTSEVAKRYPVKLVEQINKGLSSARNTAIMNMTGDYFLPLDADDKLFPQCVDRIVSRAKETNADVIAPSFRTFGTSNQDIFLMENPQVQDFKQGNRIGYFSAIKRSVLQEVGGYSPRMTWGYEDYALWFDLLKRCKKIVTIPEPLVMYRTKERSMIHEAQEHHDELMAQIVKDNPELWQK